MNAGVDLGSAIFTSKDDPRVAGYNFHFTAAGLTDCPVQTHKYEYWDRTEEKCPERE